MDDGRLLHRHKHWRQPRTTVHYHNVVIWVCHHDDLGRHHGVAMQCCDIRLSIVCGGGFSQLFRVGKVGKKALANNAATSHHRIVMGIRLSTVHVGEARCCRRCNILRFSKIRAILPVVQKLVCAPCLKHSMFDSVPQHPATSRGRAPPERLTATFTASRGAAPPPPRPAPPPTRKRAAPGPGATGHGGTML